jgi:tRNA pseudouridine38-40 synthase
MRIAIGISYDGQAYEGWQSQPSGHTIQDCLQKALSQIAATPVRLVAAGRTDTGVHALGQVAHFDCENLRRESAWVRGANAVLPDSIAIQWAREIPDTFHARFSATARRYLYLLYVNPVRPSLLSGKVGWYHAPLDIAAMQIAARQLTGRHDFSSFRSSQCQARTPIRNVTRFEIRTVGRYVVFDVQADAFLHHMVRNMVGSLLYVGKGANSPDWIETLLEMRNRRQAAPTIAPGGLYLARVSYGDEWTLPESPPQLPLSDFL